LWGRWREGTAAAERPYLAQDLQRDYECLARADRFYGLSVSQPLEYGVTELRLACQAVFFRDRAQSALDNPAKVFRDRDVRVGGVGGRDIDASRLQARKQASELFGDEVLVQSGNRFGWHGAPSLLMTRGTVQGHAGLEMPRHAGSPMLK
jgi:hypothetical protein